MVLKVPDSLRLATIVHIDEAERAQWVSAFNGGNRTLGQVILQIMKERSAHWDPVQHHAVRRPTPQASQGSGGGGGPSSPARAGHQSGGKGDGPSSPGRAGQGGKKQNQAGFGATSPGRTGFGALKIADTLRDGTVLCPTYQQNKCPEQPQAQCRHGVHKCGILLQSGRVCGSTRHVPAKCDAKGRA